MVAVDNLQICLLLAHVKTHLTTEFVPLEEVQSALITFRGLLKHPATLHAQTSPS